LRTLIAVVLLLTSGSLLLFRDRAAAQTPSVLTSATIDRAIEAEWKKARITPAPHADDATFLRRVWLDMVGVIPPPEAVTAFLTDRSPNRRARAIDALLNHPRYVIHWTNYWDNVLMGRQVRSPVVDRAAFRDWLTQQFAANTPWNRFVADLIAASGQNSPGGSYARAAGLIRPQERLAMPPEMEAENGSGSASGKSDGKVNGAVNWTLKYQQTPADLTGSASRIFLGVQIQCAQCHDHKTEKWTQEDFRRFAACFSSTRVLPLSRERQAGMIRQVEVFDLPARARPGLRRLNPNAPERLAFQRATPTALDGTSFADSPNRRQALAAWMTAPENPWFAQAIVNRMWAHFLGRGFVDPIDDFRPGNPPVMPALLKQLADDFAANGYDLKRLMRLICNTKVYQLSAAAPKGQTAGETEIALWSRYRLKPLGAEALLDSLVAATNLEPVIERFAGGNLQQIKFIVQRQFGFLFDVDEEFEQKEFEGTIPQALLLLNGSLTNSGASRIPGTALAEILAQPGTDAQKLEALALRTLSRRPTAAELARWTAFVNAPRAVAEVETAPGPAPNLRANRAKAILKQKGGGPPDPLSRLNTGRFAPSPGTARQQAYEDLFWALLNSSEFVFNH
jgi:hypothetical protein